MFGLGLVKTALGIPYFHRIKTANKRQSKKELAYIYNLEEALDLTQNVNHLSENLDSLENTVQKYILQDKNKVIKRLMEKASVIREAYHSDYKRQSFIDIAGRLENIAKNIYTTSKYSPFDIFSIVRSVSI